MNKFFIQIKLIVVLLALSTCISCASLLMHTFKDAVAPEQCPHEKIEYFLGTRLCISMMQYDGDRHIDRKVFFILDTPFSVVTDVIFVPFIAAYNFSGLYKKSKWSSVYTCSDDIEATTPTDRFADNFNGTITDKKTGLMWKKCPEGLLGNECTDGDALFLTREEAIISASEANKGCGFAGYTNWRLPEIDELYTIIEMRCKSPAINMEVFPNTPETHFWTSSDFTLQQEKVLGTVNFDSGDGTCLNAKAPCKCPFRLVRSCK